MTRKSDFENIARVKTALAEKYQRLAQTRKSKPAKATLLRHAERHRQQANVASHLAKG